MSKYGSKKKKLMACAIILSLQMQTALPVYAAEAVPKAAPPVVNIAAPDANGLSHNKTAEFNVGAEGLVFNNIANGSANTVLAGQLTANANLTNGAAQTILQEVTGGGLSNLHGVMEIAGQRANLIIANPNGINVNGAGFINVDRATLVTGKPDFTGGRLVFNVTDGRVTVEGTGNFPGEGFTSADEANTYLPNKLDIMTRAAVINGELWAKEEINVVTGANKIDYATSERQQLAADGEKPAVALDVAALGGMYAGKIMLVGTEKGLGMNLGGRISSGGDLYISNAGKLTVTENMQPGGGGERENDAAVEAGGSITLLAEELSSSSSIEAKGAVTLDVSGKLENTGSLISGAEYLQDEEADDAVFMHNEADLTLRAGELDNSGLISATKNLTVDIENGMVHSGLLTSEGSVSVTAGGSLTGSGAVGAQESVSVTADKVGLYRGNIYTYTAGTDADGNPTLTFDENKNVSVSEKNPDEIITPVNPEQPQRPQGPERPGNLAGEGAGGAAIAPLPQIAETAGIAATVEQEKAADASLALTADAGADGRYQPIIDKAANGVDLVQIAQVNGSGVSRNLYSDFNIKSGGLILNNATKYVKTELGGYIDRNMFLAGRGASVILNEVTSSSASVLNGYLEVAGNRASVVIANANGIAVNGLGFINADNAMLTTGKITGWADGNIQTGKGLGDMLLAGSGFNGQGVGNLQITTHDLTIDRSELYGHEITIDAAGSITSSGKLGGDNLRIEAAGDFSGSGEGFTEAAGNIDLRLGGALRQDKASMKAGADLNINADAVVSANNALLYAGKDLSITTSKDIENKKSLLWAGENISVTADGFANLDTALVSYGQNAEIKIADAFLNSGSTINGGSLRLTAASLTNSGQGAVSSAGDATLQIGGALTNDNATIYTAGTNKITAVTVENSNSAYLHSGGSTEIDAKALHNDNASIDAGADLHLTIPAITNENDAYLGVGGTLTVDGGSLVNQNKAYVGAAQDIIYSGQTVSSSGGSYVGAGRDVILNASEAISNTQKATLAVGGDLHLQTQVLTNADASAIAVGGSSELLAQANLSNSGGSQLEIQRRAAITTGVLLNENSYLGIGGDAEISAADELRNTDGSYLAVDGGAVITAGSFANSANSSVFVTKNLELTGAGDFLNEDGLIAIGGSGVISAANIYNQNGAGLAYGSLLNAAGSLTLNAQGTLLNRSSDIESQQQITIAAADLINRKDVFETSFVETHQEVSYKIPHLQGSRYYDAVRRFDRQILTGVIDEETNDANIISGGDMQITLQNNLTNHYSKIAAGGNLTVDAGGTVENIGYQGTKHYYDNGEDTHYWKYKKHRRFHVGCKWKYGTTIIPYSDHTVYDLPPGATSERRSLLSGVTGIKINAGKIVNRTIQADGREYVATDDTNHEILQNNVTVPEYKEKEGVGTNVGAELDNSSASAAVPVQLKKLLDIGQLAINSKIYTLNADPSAKYLVETNKKYADYHEFLSSDYLLERVKADPEKVSKRLGDGYFEQKLVIEQITQLTGKQYLGNYGSDMEQYAALMEAGALAAQEMQLTIGVGLTAQQVATLKSDIVWLVEETVNGQKVLVPEVYLASVREEDLKPSGALIIGGEVELYSKQDIENIGTIGADGTVALRGENLLNRGAVTGENIQAEAEKNIVNSGSMQAKTDAILRGENIVNEATVEETNYRELQQTKIIGTGSISAGRDVTLEASANITNRGGILAAEKDLTLSAGKTIDLTAVANEKHVAVAYGSSSAEIHSVEQQQSLLAGENISINAGENVNVSGGVLSAAQNAEISAGGDVNINAVKDIYSEESSVGSRGGSYYDRLKIVDEAVKGTSVAAGENITVTGGRDINITGSAVTSESGRAELSAGNEVNIQNETEYHERLREHHEKVSGILSRKTTDVYDYSNLNAVVGSDVSANSVEITSGADTSVKGSSVAADKDVKLTTGGDLHIESAEQTSESEYEKQVKKSGLLSGGGFGFTIGKEKQRDEYANQNSEQIGSTVGSVEGSVCLHAQGDANIKGSDVIAGKDIAISGEKVNITNTDSVYNAQERHEFERSGLTVSVGGTAVEKVTEAVGHVERAAHVEDERLAALHGYKAYDTVKDNIKEIEGAAKDPAKNISLNVSIGSTKSKSESESRTVIAQGSKVQAGGDVNITATERDINIKGSSVSGEKISLDAKENLNVTASANTNVTEQSSKSGSASVGVGIDLATGSVSGVTIGGSKAKGEVDANSTAYNESTVTADKNLDFTSGADTNIQGGKLSGERVSGSVGGDLNIESKQDGSQYKEQNSSAGLSVGYDFASNQISVGGGANKTNIDSEYSSVTEQSGIYAGKEGFDIRVEKNTDLKGGVIASEAEAEKNKISTGTLTWEDIHNKAEYEADGIGANVNIDNGADYNEKGVTPNIGMPAADEAESTTKAAVAEGTIEIRDKEQQKQDVSQLNRDTQNSLNKLGEIFDLDDVKEKQEFAGLFQEAAHRAIGDLTGKISKEEKAALNAFVDGLIAQWTNGDFLAGASGTVLLESMQGALNEIDDPAVKQIAAGVLGAVAGEIVSGNTQAGTSGAISTEKYNHLEHEQYEKMLKALADANNISETKNIFIENSELSQKQEKEWFEAHKDDLPSGYDNNGNPIYIPELVGFDLSGNKVYLTPGSDSGKIIIDSKIIAPELLVNRINEFDTKELKDGEFYSASANLGYKGYSVAVTLTVNKYNDVFQTIELGYGLSTQLIDLENIKEFLGKSTLSYSETKGMVTKTDGQVIKDKYELINTMIGLGLGLSGNILGSNVGASVSSNRNLIVNSGQGLSSDGYGVTGAITIGSYIGGRNEK